MEAGRSPVDQPPQSDRRWDSVLRAIHHTPECVFFSRGRAVATQRIVFGELDGKGENN